jgi:hypothetical protein
MVLGNEFRVARLFVWFVIGNLVVGVGSVMLGLFGVFWGTLGQAGAGWERVHAFGFELPEEVVASPAYFRLNVCALVLGVGLLIGASALVQRRSWGRLFVLLVCAFGIGVCVVALASGLARGLSAVVSIVVGLLYLLALTATTWHPKLRGFWHGPPVSGEEIAPEGQGQQE